MQVNCKRQSLAEALTVISAAVPKQATTPVSMDVWLQAGEKGLTLQSTDLTVFAEVHVLEAADMERGEALVPVTRLAGLVREASGEYVKLRRGPDEFSLGVSSDRDEFVIAGHDPGDFPEAPGESDGHVFVMESERLLEALRSVSFAASRDATRQQLMGVAFILEGRKAYFVASDGKRLAEYSVAVDEEADRRREGIVPLGAVEALERLLAMDAGVSRIRIDPDAQQVVVSHDRGKVMCRLVQGQMPDYTALIPKDFTTTVEGSARDFLMAVRKAAVLTTRDRAIVSVDVSEGGVVIRVSSQDVGSGVVAVENVAVRGDDLSASFSVQFLADGLRALGETQVKLGMQKVRGAAVLHTGKGFRYAFMPVVMHGEE